ncbi:CHAD domain-containing protein [Halomonas vilamensis]|uniref:CHAD domain-containing protein n=1 Tax=Vreelandella vilamensis TaxID=531309 RepID=A0ABU1H0V8_9GAMM|nr:CHAD domain-containing protein [Halomonas vilamensis]MDR5897392.1 CHAD domain-containing protein [Halomonas vilamensis]
MKHLFLLRHAKSSWEDPTLADNERPLSPLGETQAAAIAAGLQHRSVFAGTVYASPAVRTQQTLAELSRALPGLALKSRAHNAPALYNVEANAIMRWLVHENPSAERITLVGHNPALEQLAQQLAPKATTKLPTLGMLHLTLPIERWEEVETLKTGGELIDRLTPLDASYALFKRKRSSSPKLKKALKNKSLPKRLQTILQHRYSLVRSLEPGVIAGEDPEFLHQYRVNLRRSRAVAEAVRAVIKVPKLKKALKRIKKRAQATSELRDLDVFLLEVSDTPDLPNLGVPLRQWLRDAAHQRHQTLCEELANEAYQDDMQRWQTLIDSKAFARALATLTPKQIERVLKARIAQHDALLAELTPDSPSEALHELRKSVKRIRYLAELMPEQHSGFLKRLKPRQTLLGNFQDRTVQLAWLDAFARETPLPDTAKAELHTWRQTLIGRQQHQREQVCQLAPLAP